MRSFNAAEPMTEKEATSMGLGTCWIAAKENGIDGTLSICKKAPSHDKWIPLVKFRKTK